MKNFYAVLDVPRTATIDEIAAAYRSRIADWNPHKNPENASMHRALTEAYEALRDPQMRRHLDAELEQQDAATNRQQFKVKG